MSMEYIQNSGEFFINGIHVHTGYSGAPGYTNDTTYECLENKGPLPRGGYKMTSIGFNVTADAIRLTPKDSSTMCGRAGMLIHGDSIKNPGAASQGCIILPRQIRLQIIKEIGLGNDELEVK